MTVRRLSLSAALMIFFALHVYARGAYQRTMDGRTLVWNDHPAAGYQATWTGERDREGYAKGQGTIAWYRVSQPVVTGSNIPSVRRGGTEFIARYSGKTVRGRFEGEVERIDSDGRTFHATFAQGDRASNWAAGPSRGIESAGGYQRTKDGATLVWNEHPGRGYEATWTGGRDSHGYAKGEGTLSFFSFEGAVVTGSSIPSSRVPVVDHYSGKMVRGKLDGTVERMDANGTVFHATYANGKRAGAWAIGPALKSVAEQPHQENPDDRDAAEQRARSASTRPYRRAEPVDESTLAATQPEPTTTSVPQHLQDHAAKRPAPTRTTDQTALAATQSQITTASVPQHLQDRAEKRSATATNNDAALATPQPQPATASVPQQLQDHAEKQPAPAPTPDETALGMAQSEAATASVPRHIQGPSANQPAVAETSQEDTLATAKPGAATIIVQQRGGGNPAAKPPVAETPSGRRDTFAELFRPPSSLRNPPAPSAPSEPSGPSATSLASDSAEKNRSIAHLKERSDAVLSQVSDVTGSFRQIDRLTSVERLPASVAENINSLSEFRSTMTDETALPEYRVESTTIDALGILEQVTRDIADKNAPAAASKVANFLTNNPGPIADDQTNLWRYLASIRSQCSQSEQEAATHLSHAQSLSSAGKIREAIHEYQEAQRIFPNPTTAEKIRELLANGRGP